MCPIPVHLAPDHMLTLPINTNLCLLMAKNKLRTLDYCTALSSTSPASRLLLGVLLRSNGGAYALLWASTAQFWGLRRSAISESGIQVCAEAPISERHDK